ncbi:MAG TPA: NADH-quinone oxidoreductase subunit H [Thermoclostridium sp.]|nr:NADH-quinone oxidoreductase subunit H [Thermoclostridium sp.]
MLRIIIWFIAIILIVPVVYIVDNYLKTIMRWQGKSYILQPIYRIIKLFEKKDETINYFAYFFSIGAFVFSLMALYMTVAGFNFLFVISVLSMMELFIIIGAYSNNTFSGKICAQRAVSRFIILLFTSMVAATTIYKATGALSLSVISDYSKNNGVFISLIFTFISLFVILLNKGNIGYFNFGISGTELSVLDGALYAPYSGWSLALVQITHWIEIGIWIKILSVFLPLNEWVSFLVVMILYLLFLLWDGFVAKVNWKESARRSWIWAGGMSLLNFISLYVL